MRRLFQHSLVPANWKSKLGQRFLIWKTYKVQLRNLLKLLMHSVWNYRTDIITDMLGDVIEFDSSFIDTPEMSSETETYMWFVAARLFRLLESSKPVFETTFHNSALNILVHLSSVHCFVEFFISCLSKLSRICQKHIFSDCSSSKG